MTLEPVPPAGSDEPIALRWGRRKRLEFIDFRLTWEGRINRSDLMNRFDVSVPQASGDLSAYQSLAPENVVYDRSLKAYVASERFRPLFAQPPEDYLNELAAVAQGMIRPSDASVPMAATDPARLATLPQALRRVDASVLRAVLRGIRERLDLEVSYQSMSSLGPRRRWIGPHALVYDGRRWHTRAWSGDREAYGDFVLARILAVEGERPAEPRPARDPDWEETVEVVLVPNPNLPEAQRQIIELDFGMVGGEARLPVRRALLLYFRRQYNLVPDTTGLPPQEYQVVVRNVADVWPEGGDAGQPGPSFQT